MRELKDNGQNDVKDTGNHSKKQSSKWVAWVWGGVGLFALVFPLTIIGIPVGRLVTRFVRVPVYSFTLVVALVVAAYLRITGLPSLLGDAGDSLDGWLAALENGDPIALATAAPYTLGLGLIVGALWTLLKKDVENPRHEIWSVFLAMRLAGKIRQGKSFYGGYTVGVQFAKPWKRSAVSKKTAGGHLLFTGGTGSGKTTAVVSVIADAVAQGRPVVYLDLKGATDVPMMLAGLAEQYNRGFQHFAITDKTTPYVGPSSTGSSNYNPASYGDATRRKDLITGAMASDVEYYDRMVGSYLQTAFTVLLAAGDLEHASTLVALREVMKPTDLLRKVNSIPAGEADMAELSELRGRCEGYVKQMKEREFNSAISSALTYLRTFTDSSVGHLLTNEGDVVDLSEVDRMNSVVCFSLNSSQYPKLAKALATLIVQDVTTYSGNRSDKTTPFLFVVDEFSAIDDNNLINLVSRGRSSGVNVLLATQTLADLDTRDSSKFRKQILNTIAGFVVFRTNTDDDAKVYAGLTGDTSMEGGLATRWQNYQTLEQGECYYINKTPTSKEERITLTKVILREITLPEEFTIQGTGLVTNSDWLDDANVDDIDENLVTLLDHPVVTHSDESAAVFVNEAATVPVNGSVSERERLTPVTPTYAFGDLDFEEVEDVEDTVEDVEA